MTVASGTMGCASPPDPSTRSATIAAFGCLETDRIGHAMGRNVAVLLVTDDPAASAARLAATRHAAYRLCEAWFDPFDDGLTCSEELAYAHRPFDPRWLGAARLPDEVRIAGGCLSVTLPRGCSPPDLATMVRAGLADRTFEAVAGMPAEVRRRFGSGRPLHVGPRYALAAPGRFDRLVRVEDLYAFCPRDLPIIVGIAAMAVRGLALRSLVSLKDVAR